MSSPGNLTVNVNQTAAMTADGAATIIASQNGLTASSIYNPWFGPFAWDALRVNAIVPNGSTGAQMNGIGKRDSAFIPLIVGCISEACNGSKGLNTVCNDSATRAVNSLTGIAMFGYEADFNVMCPNTKVEGVLLNGASLAQPSVANGFVVDHLSQTPGQFKWTSGFMTNHGAANTALWVGAAQASGSSISSQPILFNYYNSSAALTSYTIGVTIPGDTGGTWTIERKHFRCAL